MQKHIVYVKYRTYIEPPLNERKIVKQQNVANIKKGIRRQRLISLEISEKNSPLDYHLFQLRTVME